VRVGRMAAQGWRCTRPVLESRKRPRLHGGTGGQGLYVATCVVADRMARALPQTSRSSRELRAIAREGVTYRNDPGGQSLIGTIARRMLANVHALTRGCNPRASRVRVSALESSPATTGDTSLARAPAAKSRPERAGGLNGAVPKPQPASLYPCAPLGGIRAAVAIRRA
jgi:hypothetical protein